MKKLSSKKHIIFYGTVLTGILVVFSLFSQSPINSLSANNLYSYVPDSAVRFFNAYVSFADAGVACPPSDQNWSVPAVVAHMRGLPYTDYWRCIAEKVMYEESGGIWNNINPTSYTRGVYQYLVPSWKGGLVFAGQDVVINRQKDACNYPVFDNDIAGLEGDLNPDYLIWNPIVQSDVFYAHAYLTNGTCAGWATCSEATAYCPGVYVPSF